MHRFLSVLACLLLVGHSSACDRKPAAPAVASSTIAGTLLLTIESDAPTDSFWVILGRDGAFQKEDYKTQRVPTGTRTALEWKESSEGPRTWKLPFGVSRHPTYTLIVAPDRGEKPMIDPTNLDSFHDPAKALAMAYFAIPLDGSRELKVSVKKPAPLEASVVDPSGAPIEGIRVVGIPTPRYVFLDGFSPERVDETHLSWPWAFWNWDHVPHQKGKPAQVLTAKTDAKGRCEFEGFVGWVGISERDERSVLPRSLLVGPEERGTRFVVAQKPASVRLTVEGLPGKDYPTPERGVLVEGEWPVPPGSAKARWSERLNYVQGKTAEFFTPCREVRVKPLTRVHRVSQGAVIQNLALGEARKHSATFEELPHKTIEGEVHLEEIGSVGREHCSVELYDAGDPGRLLCPLGTVGGPGVPKSGRVPFVFHVFNEGPFAMAIRTGNYPWTVVRDVKAPKEEMVVRLNKESKRVHCDLRVLDEKGAEVKDWVAGNWPHRDLVNGFHGGSSVSADPGLNTFIVHALSGSAVLRDVDVQEGRTRLVATLTPGLKVSGRVVDPDGKPVAGLWVHLSWPGYFRMPNAYRWLADLTGEDGRFEIPQVPPGRWRLYAKKSGMPAGKVFEIPAGAAAQDLGDLTLPRTEGPETK